MLQAEVRDEQFRDKYRIQKKDMGGLIETKKPGSAPTGTVPEAPAAQPAEAGGKAAEPAPAEVGR